MLVLTGFIASEAVVAMGFDTGIRWHNFRDLIFYILILIRILILILVFQSAYTLDFRALLGELASIILLAIPMVLVATLITALIVYYAIGAQVGFPWIAALVSGVLLAATNSAGVLAACKRIPGSQRISVVLEGESLFNEATAIVLFGILMAMLAAPTAGLSLPLELEAWFTIQSMAYGVVLFTLFVQAPLMPRLLRHVTKSR
jgi:CPA1 family monovalent cation:H+ antiporter